MAARWELVVYKGHGRKANRNARLALAVRNQRGVRDLLFADGSCMIGVEPTGIAGLDYVDNIPIIERIALLDGANMRFPVFVPIYRCEDDGGVFYRVRPGAFHVDRFSRRDPVRLQRASLGGAFEFAARDYPDVERATRVTARMLETRAAGTGTEIVPVFGLTSETRTYYRGGMEPRVWSVNHDMPRELADSFEASLRAAQVVLDAPDTPIVPEDETTLPDRTDLVARLIGAA